MGSKLLHFGAPRAIEDALVILETDQLQKPNISENTIDINEPVNEYSSITTLYGS